MQQPPQNPNRNRLPKQAIRYSEADIMPVQPRKGKRRRSSRRKRRRMRFIRMCTALVLLLALVITIVVLLVKQNSADGWYFTQRGEDYADAGNDAQPREADALYVDSPYYENAIPLLLNADNPLPDGFEVETASVGPRPDTGETQSLQKDAAAAFLDMQAAAAADGITLSPYSGYRNHQRQVNNYNNSIQNYLAQGLTQDEAERRTQQYYAIPGRSEHEAGLAIDINSTATSFENTPAFAWLQERCSDYGFILRYERDTEAITGIAYEPWHYRYVGINHAKAIQAQGITLEEYVEKLSIG